MSIPQEFQDCQSLTPLPENQSSTFNVKLDVEKRLPIPGDDKTECTTQMSCGIWPCMLIIRQSVKLKVILLNSCINLFLIHNKKVSYYETSVPLSLNHWKYLRQPFWGQGPVSWRGGEGMEAELR